MTIDTEELIKQYKELPIIKMALVKLKTELPENLYYHSLAHTEDVLAEAIRFAVADSLSDREINLLAIAGAYHDFGFLVRYSQNEVYGAEFAALAMEQAGIYSPYEIEQVSNMILDTALTDTEEGLRPVAHSKLSGYLIDADLSNLGRTDFAEKTALIAKEGSITVEKVYPNVLSLMKAHKWYSNAARSLRETQKEINIEFVISNMNKADGTS